MWPFSDDPELDEVTSDFSGVADSIFEQAETEEAGLLALQDAYKSYEFENPTNALNIFEQRSNDVRKKFGDTKPFDYQTTFDLAPRNFEEFTSDLEDPDENNIDVINKWEEANLSALAESQDLNYIQLRPQLERSIKQIATIKRREIYGSDNYLVTDQVLRLSQGAIGPLASLVGLDSVNDWFTENTDPDGANAFGYVVGGDDSYWSAISSGLGSVAGAVGSGLATGGWGTVGYLGASGAGAVRERVEDALENEASTGEAVTAGLIEGASQIGQTVVGAKVFGGAVNKILGKSANALGQRVFPNILKAGLLEGGTEAAGQVVSNVAQNVGRGDEFDKNLLEGTDKSFVAGFVGGGLATGAGEVFSDSLLETDGTSPPIQESIPGKAVSTTLEEPGKLHSTLTDGSQIVEADGNYNLVKDGKVLQAYDAVKTVDPKVAENLRQLIANGNPDGTAISLTTDGENLLIESEFVNQDLTPSNQKTGKLRVQVPVSETTQGTPVFVSKTRTTEGVRQNPFFIAPGNIESTASAAKAGFGKQYVSPFMKRQIEKYSPDLSEELGLIAKGAEELPDGTTVETVTPLHTKFKGTHSERGIDAATFIDQNGVIGSINHLRTNDKFNETDVAVSNILVNKLQSLHSQAQTEFAAKQDTESLNKLANVGNLLTEANLLKDKVSTTSGRMLGSLTTKADQFHNAKAYGEFRVSQLEAEAVKSAYDEYQQKTGEAVDLKTWTENAKVAGDEVKSLEGELDKINKTKEAVDNLKVQKISSETEIQNADAEIEATEAKINAPKKTRKGPSDEKIANAQKGLEQAENEKQQKRELLRKLKAAKKRREAATEKLKIATDKLAEAEKKAAEVDKVRPEINSKLATAKENYNKRIQKILDLEKVKEDKLKDLTPEAKAELAGMYELFGKLDGEMKFKYAEKLFDKEAELTKKDITPDRFDQIYNFFRSNILSGPGTQLRNLLGNTSKAISDVVGLIGAGEFKQAGAYLDGWLKATPESLKEAKEIVVGRRAGRFKFDQKSTDADKFSKVAPINNPLTAIQNIMYRLLTAQDAVFYRNANSAMAGLAEHIASKHIKDPKERKAYIEKALGYSELENIKAQVNKEAQLLKDAGINVTQGELDLDVAYRMEKLRSEKTREIADKFGERSTFINDPTGIMGKLYEGIEKVSDIAVPFGGTEVKPLKFFLPFTRVAANVASHIMEYTPVGIVKGVGNNPDKTNAISHGLSNIEAKMVLGRGIVGSSLIAGFFAFAEAFKDDEDPKFAFYGYPPKGKWQEWKAKGIDPYSMKIGNNIIPLQGTSLAVIPAIVGGMIESLKSGASEIEVLKAGAISSIGTVSTMSFLKPAGELFDYLIGSKDTTVGQVESGTAAKRELNFLKGQADLLVSGFIPASGFLNNLGRWMNQSPAETYNNFSAKLLADMPFSEKVIDRQPQLNMFGEPITKSLVERMSAGLAPHTIKTDPVFLWMAETGFDIPDQGPIFRLTNKKEKELFGEVQKNITGYDNILNEEQSRRVLQISGPRIKEFLNSIRRDPNFQVKGEKTQKFIDDTVSEIRAEAKLLVLSN